MEDTLEGIIALIIMGGILYWIFGVFSDSNSSYSRPASSFGEYYIEENGGRFEIENPYVENSGHGKGYEWAERTGGACSGNSVSFNEGCEEYHRQSELSR